MWYECECYRLSYYLGRAGKCFLLQMSFQSAMYIVRRQDSSRTFVSLHHVTYPGNETFPFAVNTPFEFDHQTVSIFQS